MKLLLVGMNHRSAPLEVRERLAVEDPAPMLRKLLASEEIDEAVLLSTCNRIEVVVLTRNADAARMRLGSFFRRDLAGSDDGAIARALDESLYEHRDGDAMRHVLRVTSALDSMVVGEPQILGQTKEAYRAAVECGASGPILDRLFQRAFATAKRVRNDTRIAEGSVSVARVAVSLARQIFEELEDKRALLVGAGEMIEMALAALRDNGLQRAAVANRTAERAARLAVEFGATAHGLDELPALLVESDVVLTCIGGDRPILTREVVKTALHARRSSPMFIIDIGVPRNVDPAIDEFDEVYRYDIDDLVGVANENAEER
ncbi:MAG: glutamyl-tRNA reductase, partial [Myxococcales bacterium]|nr:glutamyl-tRNA reductase [Myxococcales bacterium]